MKISHGPLDEVTPQREGTILVKRFVDEREPEQKPYIGNKRNGFGMVLGHVAALEGVEIESRLAEYFAEALRQAGYEAIVADPQAATGSDGVHYDAVLEGRIQTFWLDLYMAVWHKVAVNLSLLDQDSQRVLWEGDVEGSEANTLWIGATAEFEKVVRQAMTQALNRAATEFASEDFYQSVRGAR